MGTQSLPSSQSAEGDRVAMARHQVRELERFAYRVLGDATSEDKVHEARTILRLSVGLRRKLDLWKE